MEAHHGAVEAHLGAVGAQKRAEEANVGAFEGRRRPVVADSHDFAEEQDPDSHQSKGDPDRHQSEMPDPEFFIYVQFSHFPSIFGKTTK